MSWLQDKMLKQTQKVYMNKYLNLSQMKLGDQVHPQSYLCKVKDPPCCESKKDWLHKLTKTHNCLSLGN